MKIEIHLDSFDEIMVNGAIMLFPSSYDLEYIFAQNDAVFLEGRKIYVDDYARRLWELSKREDCLRMGLQNMGLICWAPTIVFSNSQHLQKVHFVSKAQCHSCKWLGWAADIMHSDIYFGAPDALSVERELSLNKYSRINCPNCDEPFLLNLYPIWATSY